MLCSSDLLVLYDTSKPLVFSCDTSSFGIGCVLQQRNNEGALQPVAYASRTLNPAERNYSMFVKKALACVFGVSKNAPICVYEKIRIVDRPSSPPESVE